MIVEVVNDRAALASEFERSVRDGGSNSLRSLKERAFCLFGNFDADHVLIALSRSAS